MPFTECWIMNFVELFHVDISISRIIFHSDCLHVQFLYVAIASWCLFFRFISIIYMLSTFWTHDFHYIIKHCIELNSLMPGCWSVYWQIKSDKSWLHVQIYCMHLISFAVITTREKNGIKHVLNGESHLSDLQLI